MEGCDEQSLGPYFDQWHYLPRSATTPDMSLKLVQDRWQLMCLDLRYDQRAVLSTHP